MGLELYMDPNIKHGHDDEYRIAKLNQYKNADGSYKIYPINTQNGILRVRLWNYSNQTPFYAYYTGASGTQDSVFYAVNCGSPWYSDDTYDGHEGYSIMVPLTKIVTSTPTWTNI